MNVSSSLNKTTFTGVRRSPVAQQGTTKKTDPFEQQLKQISTLTDKNIAEILRVYNNDPTLTKLNLTNNKIGDSGAKALAEALTVNQAITELYLWNNNISEELKNQIEAKIKQNKDK